jgi:hypothetical protein
MRPRRLLGWQAAAKLTTPRSKDGSRSSVHAKSFQLGNSLDHFGYGSLPVIEGSRDDRFPPLLKFKLGQYPPSVVSLIHSAAAHRSGRARRPSHQSLDFLCHDAVMFQRQAELLEP